MSAPKDRFDFMKYIGLPLMVGLGCAIYEPRQPQSIGLVVAMVSAAHLAARFARDQPPTDAKENAS